MIKRRRDRDVEEAVGVNDAEAPDAAAVGPQA